jgi:uncharacterized membrane protein YhaH (DUF805 family)
MNRYLQTFKSLTDFSGRATLAEFWHFWWVNIFLGVVLGAVSQYEITAITALALITLLPFLAVGSRRLHDTNRSAHWLWIGLVPLGGIVLLILFAQRGKGCSNRFGPNPRLRISHSVTC